MVSRGFSLFPFLCCMWQWFLFHSISKGHHGGTEEAKAVQFPLSRGNCFNNCRIMTPPWLASLHRLHPQRARERTISTGFRGFHCRLLLDETNHSQSKDVPRICRQALCNGTSSVADCKISGSFQNATCSCQCAYISSHSGICTTFQLSCSLWHNLGYLL